MEWIECPSADARPPTWPLGLRSPSNQRPPSGPEGTRAASHPCLVIRREEFPCTARRERRADPSRDVGTRSEQRRDAKETTALRVASRRPRGFVVRRSRTRWGWLRPYASPRGSLGATRRQRSMGLDTRIETIQALPWSPWHAASHENANGTCPGRCGPPRWARGRGPKSPGSRAFNTASGLGGVRSPGGALEARNVQPARQGASKGQFRAPGEAPHRGHVGIQGQEPVGRREPRQP